MGPLGYMNLIEGGNEPGAHMQRRMRPTCDICGVVLRGPMPKPFWMAPSARGSYAHGHPAMDDSTVRVYLCFEHRKVVQDAVDSTWRREADRTIAGQGMFPGNPSVRPVEPFVQRRLRHPPIALTRPKRPWRAACWTS